MNLFENKETREHHIVLAFVCLTNIEYKSEFSATTYAGNKR